MTVHLSPERLLAAEKTDEEQAHLAACVECRVRELRLRDFVGSTLGSASTDTAPDRPAPDGDTALDLAPGTVIEKYVIEGVIGAGAMAVVYRARHTQLGSLHAIKVLTIPSRPVRERLLREGRSQAALRHPNVVPVTDVISVGGAPGLVMDLIEGPTLAQLLEQRGRLPIELADELARGLLAGVGAAHRAGLVHRDLKPANILLAPTPTGFVPKIADFGLAKALDQAPEGPALTRTSAMLGTPRYMSPEQVEDPSRVDARSDLFALGAILYELLAGRPAFTGDTLLTLLQAITEGRHVPLREAAPDAPARMVEAVTAALQVDRDRRVADVEALEALWRGSPVSPASPGTAEPAPTHPRRRAGWVVGFAAVALVAVALAAALLRPSPPPPAADYMPLSPGRWWKYSMVDPNTGQSLREKVLQVGAEAVIGGLKPDIRAFPLLRTDGNGQATRWIRSLGSTVVWDHDEWKNPEGTITRSLYYQPPRVRVDNSPEHSVPGATWTEAYDEVTVDPLTGTVQSRDRKEVHWTVEAANEEVTVPAGTFRALRLLRVEGNEHQTQWYVDGVGKVKEDNPPKEYEELLDYGPRPGVTTAEVATPPVTTPSTP